MVNQKKGNKLVSWIFIILGVILIAIGVGAFWCANALIAWILIIVGILLIPFGIGARYCYKK